MSKTSTFQETNLAWWGIRGRMRRSSGTIWRRSMPMLDEGLARLRVNSAEMVMQCVLGQIAHPVGRANPYRIGQDGVPRVLPGTGGITISHRIGDPCVGLAGDHVEPGVARSEE